MFGEDDKKIKETQIFFYNKSRKLVINVSK